MNQPSKALIGAIEAHRSSLDRWLTFWTWLVVIGVAFELVTVIRDYVEDKGVWHLSRSRAVIPVPERPSRLWVVVPFGFHRPSDW
jgi:hypothetical protein